MDKEIEEIDEEGLRKLISQAGYWDHRVTLNGRSGESWGAEALARLLVLNFKSQKALLKSAKTLNILTAALIVLTIVLAILAGTSIFVK